MPPLAAHIEVKKNKKRGGHQKTMPIPISLKAEGTGGVLFAKQTVIEFVYLGKRIHLDFVPPLSAE